MPNEERLAALRREALRMLSGRALTSLELKRRLCSKGATDDEADAIAREMAGNRYVDEEGLAEDAIRQAAYGKLVGRSYVRRTLAARGVLEEEVERQLEEGYTPEAELAAALRFAERKLRLVGGLPRKVQHRRIGAALNRRGFPGDLIRQVLDKLNFDGG